jgi:Glycosyl-transferase for dystroglycan
MYMWFVCAHSRFSHSGACFVIRWQAEAEVVGQEVHVSHNVTNFEFLYEPFYVAPDTAPAHDERFIGYGYTRNTQVSKIKSHTASLALPSALHSTFEPAGGLFTYC